MPEIKTINVQEESFMGIFIENQEISWPDKKDDITLPLFDNQNNQTYFIEIYNKGLKPFYYKITQEHDFIKLSKTEGEIKYEDKIYISIDWDKLGYGEKKSFITIYTNKDTVKISVPLIKYKLPENFKGHIENDGYISIESSNYYKIVNTDNINWQIIPEIGRTKDGITIFPVTINNLNYIDKVPRIEYKLFFLDTGTYKIYFYVSPTLNYYNTKKGLCFTTWLNNDTSQVICMHENDIGVDWKYPQWWNNAVSNNIRIYEKEIKVSKSGENILNIGAIDAGVIIQKIVIDTGNLKDSYLGPPETFKF